MSAAPWRLAAAVAAGWEAFFHRQEPVAGLALFRILLGLLLLLNWALLAPDLLTWLGEAGALAPETARTLAGPRLSLFAVVPATDAWTVALFLGTVLATLGLTAGYRTRWSAALTFLGLVSIHHRNPLILHSGDALLRLVTFLLILSPAGETLSVDRWLRRGDGPAGAAPVRRPAWARRLIQLQVSALYLSAAGWKLAGEPWRDGTAVYYVLRLSEFYRFPLPLEDRWIESLAVTRALTWASLAIELALGILVWVPRLRYPVLVAGAGLHLALEYTLNIPLFQWLMLACLVTFVPPDDLVRAGRWLRAHLGRRPAPVVPAGGA
jgi:hypothetical protein